MKITVITAVLVTLLVSVTSVYMFISECNFGWLIGAIWSLFGAFVSGMIWAAINDDPEEETEEEIVIYKRF